MEKYKKAIVYQNILSFRKKVAKLPNRVPVASQLCEQKNQIKCQKAVLSHEKYAFEKLKNQRILLVEYDFELNILAVFSFH
jgi:hypothetical protein